MDVVGCLGGYVWMLLVVWVDMCGCCWLFGWICVDVVGCLGGYLDERGIMVGWVFG